MTASRDPERLIRAFLDEGPTDLSDRTYDAVRSHIDRTRQRVVIGPWREPRMSNIARFAIAAAAVLVVVVVGYNVLPGSGGTGDPGPSPSVSATATPTPKPILGSTTKLDPGRYRFTFIPPGATAPFPMSITLPAGWSGFGFGIDKNYGPLEADAGAALAVWEITNRYVDPCTDHTLLDPAPGPGIDELIDALATQPGIDAGPPTDVTVDGYRGKYIELTVTTDIDTCGFQGFWPWWGEDRRYVQGTNEMNRIYVLDVDGVRHTFYARIPARTTAADRAELEAIIASIDIEP